VSHRDVVDEESQAQIDMFTLLEKTFGGSGYDLASAGCSKAIFYNNKNKKAFWEEIDLNFPFKKNLFFVYLGKKKNSREAISHYRISKNSNGFIEKISKLSDDMSKAKTLDEFQGIMLVHERILSNRLLIPTLNDSIFKDNKNIVAKSLGGWGGDFALLATDLSYEEVKVYMFKKGMDVVLKWEEMTSV